jgi:alkylation response protein AidB-like acyl-CoA dehydrogenase
MKIGLSDEQEMLRAATRQLAEKEWGATRLRELVNGAAAFDSTGWRAGAGLAWPAMFVPDAYGGAGKSGGVITAAVVGEELGRSLHPAPYVEVNVTADALNRVGTDIQRQQFLPGVTAGTTVITWAVADDSRSWDGTGGATTAVPSGTGWLLCGHKTAVRDAAIADHLLVTAAGPTGPVQLLVPTSAEGVSIAPPGGLDLTRQLHRVAFDRVEVDADSLLGDPGDHAAIDRQLQLAAVLTCADAVGATGRLFEITVGYARDRMAFGRPIGSFQAIKHQLADGLTWLEAAQAATWEAADQLEASHPDAAETVSVAKGFVGEHCPRIAQMCMQVHGGIAMTWEHDAHLYLRRVRTDDALYGSAGWHRDHLCSIVGMGPFA